MPCGQFLYLQHDLWVSYSNKFSLGTKRFDSEKAGDREVQRTMLELLNQLDGFQPNSKIKVPKIIINRAPTALRECLSQTLHLLFRFNYLLWIGFSVNVF